MADNAAELTSQLLLENSCSLQMLVSVCFTMPALTLPPSRDMLCGCARPHALICVTGRVVEASAAVMSAGLFHHCSQEGFCFRSGHK